MALLPYPTSSPAALNREAVNHLAGNLTETDVQHDVAGGKSSADGFTERNQSFMHDIQERGGCYLQ